MDTTIEYGKRIERNLNELIEHSLRQEMANAELKNLTRLLLNVIMDKQITLTHSEGETIKQKVIELGIM